MGTSTDRLVEQLQHLMPMFDRFGRVLGDAAPHFDIEYSERESDSGENEEDIRSQRAPLSSVAGLVEGTRGRRTSNLNSLDPHADPIRGPPAGGDARRTVPSRSHNSMDHNLVANLPPALRQLLQPRPPSPPPERAYSQVINSAPRRSGSGGFGGVNHLVDIHIHAILSPPR
jgi:hypothetical protein